MNVGLEKIALSVEVLSGLEEGQKVVTSAQFLLDSESSISADFGRMLEAQKQQEAETQYDPDKEDEDLDWLDFGNLNTNHRINHQVVML